MFSIHKSRSAIMQLAEDLHAAYDGKHGEPIPGSIADQELSACPAAELLQTAWSIHALQVEYSAEHLTAFAKMLTEPVEPLACLSSARSMLEACAIAAWILDPSINGHQRLSRAFAFRYEGLIQQRKFLRFTQNTQSEIAKVNERIDSLEQKALNLGFSPVVSKKGDRIGVGERMPGATEIIDRVLGEGWAYCAFSAIAHGHTWAIQQIGFSRVAHVADAESPSGTGVLLEKRPNEYAIALASLAILRGIARPLVHAWKYFGRDDTEMTGALNKFCDATGVNPEKKFW